MQNQEIVVELPDGRIGRVVMFRTGLQPRLGFDFPDDVTIHREEVYAAIQQEKSGRRLYRAGGDDGR